MRTPRLAAAVALAALLAASGCGSDDTPSAEAQAPSVVASAPSHAEAGAETIRDVWDKIRCETDDPNGSRGRLDVGISPPGSPVVQNGMCKPYGGGGGMVFFFQLEDNDAVPEWLASGELEVGPTDTVFVDGAVVVVARDPETAQMLASVLTPLE